MAANDSGPTLMDVATQPSPTPRHIVATSWLVLALQAAAFWPVWRWYLSRMTDGADEPWGVIALLAAIGLCVLVPHRRAPAITFGNLLAALLVTLVYAAVYAHVPPLVRGILAMTALALILSRVVWHRTLQPGVWALLLLALPVIASMQFFLGYPLRLVVGWLSLPMVNLAGHAAKLDGAALRISERTIVIDAPCSGIRMLWAGAFLLAILATAWNLNWRKCIIAGLATVLIIIVGNALRSASLTLLELSHLHGDLSWHLLLLDTDAAWLHEAVGIVVFALTAAGIALLTHRLAVAGAEPLPHSSDAPLQSVSSLRSTRVAPGTLIATLVVFTAAALAPLAMPAGQDLSPDDITHVDWPTHFNGLPLRQLELTSREEALAQGFPGQIGRFTDGQREIIFRHITRPTRSLHPSADCLRASGYAIAFESLWRDSDGVAWMSFIAKRPDAPAMRIREHITDSRGGQWTDVSAWYWSATMGTSTGPWWMITIAHDADDEADGKPK